MQLLVEEQWVREHFQDDAQKYSQQLAWFDGVVYYVEIVVAIACGFIAVVVVVIIATTVVVAIREARLLHWFMHLRKFYTTNLTIISILNWDDDQYS